MDYIPGGSCLSAAWRTYKYTMLKLFWILYHGIYTSVYTRYRRAHISIIAFK